MAKNADKALPYRVKDIRGQRFSRLLPIEYGGQNKFRAGMWKCKCDCGNTVEVSSNSLRTGHTKSCGCFFKDTRKTCSATHGGCYEPEYWCWAGMMKRCYNKSHKSYPLYGALGVKVQDSWHNYRAFITDIIAEIGPRPSKYHSIDRFPNRSGNYESGNVRWSNAKEQSRNTKTNVILTHDGKSLCMSEWSEIKGWKRSKLKCRIYAGWSVERALNTP